MSKFLDNNGVLYLWQKIKAAFVAKESGKGLSTNDFTAAYKTKLDGIATNANAYVHPGHDVWTAPSSDATITGKVGIGDNAGTKLVLYSYAVDSLGHVTDRKQTTVELKADLATTTLDGAMSASDKGKLNGIAAGATANVGTITGIKMNGSSKGTTGVVDLGTVITAHQTVKQDGVTGATVNRFGTCGTAAATAAKTVDITTGTFALEAGARVSVKFTNANTAGTPTLNVNSKGAKNIFHKGAQITTGGNKALLAGVVDFIYDGTQWHLIGNYVDTDTNTKVTSVGNHYAPSADTDEELAAALSGTAGAYALNTEYTVLTGVKAQRDAKGHVTGLTYTAQKVKDTNTTYSAATQSANGLMSKDDKKKLDGFGAASTYALKTDLAGLYKYKGSKATYSALPTSGNTTGDVWDVQSDGMNYAWNGSEWDQLGATFTIDAITNSEIDTIVAS